MSKAQAAIRREPTRWVERFSQHLRRDLFAEEVLDGPRPSTDDAESSGATERAFMLMAEMHRLLGRHEHAMADAFCCQSLKAIEQVSLDRGDWSLGGPMRAVRSSSRRAGRGEAVHVRSR